MSPSKPVRLDEYEGDSISSTPRPAADSLSDLSIPAVDKLSAHVQAISTPLTANSATSCNQQTARDNSHERVSGQCIVLRLFECDNPYVWSVVAMSLCDIL